MAAKSTVTTLVSSFAGAVVAIFQSLYETDGKIDVLMIINGILGGLVGVTAGCAIVTPIEAIPIGCIGSFLANVTPKLLVYLRVDDAVGATCVHGFGGVWSMLAIGIFGARDNLEGFLKYNGEQF